MGKLPGLVNYSDDEDQSASSSDEEQQQVSPDQGKQISQTATSSSQSPSPSQRPPQQPQPQQPQLLETETERILIDEKCKTNASAIEPASPSSSKVSSSLPPSSPAIEVPTIGKLTKSISVLADRSTRLKAILTPKPIPSVENWGIPPEPESECDPDRLEQIQHYLSLRQSGHRLNDHLQRNKAFRNPRIYAKLVEFVELDETGSNFPPEEFDPKGFPSSSYIDGILETQKRIAEEKLQQQQNRSQVAFVPSAKSTAPAGDASAKLAAAMANAAKIANKIVRPTQQTLPSSSSTSTSGTAPLSSTVSTTTSHSSPSGSSLSSLSSKDYQETGSKRSSHRDKWDRSDSKRRHHG